MPHQSCIRRVWLRRMTVTSLSGTRLGPFNLVDSVLALIVGADPQMSSVNFEILKICTKLFVKHM